MFAKGAENLPAITPTDRLFANRAGINANYPGRCARCLGRNLTGHRQSGHPQPDNRVIGIMLARQNRIRGDATGIMIIDFLILKSLQKKQFQ